MKRRTGLLVAIGIGLSCGRPDPLGGEGMRGAAATRLATDAFVANPQCTIAATWDPPLDAPSAAALAQLAPQGKLRVGVYTGNATVASLANGVVSGPSVDVACRLANQLHLPLEITPETTVSSLLSDYTAQKWDIGFSIDPTVVSGIPGNLAYVHAFAAAEQTYLVPAASVFQTVNDVDKPGNAISVLAGTGTDGYLTNHLQFATLMRFSNNNNAFSALKSGQAQAFAIGRAGATMFNTTWGPGNGRILPDNYTLIVQYPFMRNTNADAICYLTDYIEAAKTSGLLTEALARSPPPTIGRVAPAPLPGCPPSARCHDVTVPADNACSGNASIQASADDADSDLAGCTQDPAGPYALGTTPVTLTCADAEGLTSTCTATVTVVDTTPPVIACPADQTLECTAEGALASFAPTVIDNCSTASVQCTPPSGTTFPEDTAPTAVSCLAVDAAGNQAACGFQIAVHDTLPPIVTPKLEANGFSATLWPPDHRYHTVTLSDCIQSVADQCDGALPVRGTILRVTSDEPENGEDDDGTCDDIVLVDSTTVKLRAERRDESDGRVYSISALISDDHGNQAPLTCRVQVPRHHKKSAVEGAAVYCVGRDCGSVPGHHRRCRRDDDDGGRNDDSSTRHGRRRPKRD